MTSFIDQLISSAQMGYDWHMQRQKVDVPTKLNNPCYYVLQKASQTVQSQPSEVTPIVERPNIRTRGR